MRYREAVLVMIPFFKGGLDALWPEVLDFFSSDVGVGHAPREGAGSANEGPRG
jgi:hypothetical protein